LAIGDVRPVEAREEDEEQLQASTPLEGPKVTGSAEEQTLEVPRNSPEVSGNVAGTQRENLRRFRGLRGQHQKTL
jgi:hypothetical protein